MQTITIVFRLRATDGTTAVQVVSFRKLLPPPKANARCGGGPYRGRYVSEVKGAAGTGWFGIDDQRGTAKLRITAVQTFR